MKTRALEMNEVLVGGEKGKRKRTRVQVRRRGFYIAGAKEPGETLWQLFKHRGYFLELWFHPGMAWHGIFQFMLWSSTLVGITSMLCVEWWAGGRGSLPGLGFPMRKTRTTRHTHSCLHSRHSPHPHSSHILVRARNAICNPELCSGSRPRIREREWIRKYFGTSISRKLPKLKAASKSPQIRQSLNHRSDTLLLHPTWLTCKPNRYWRIYALLQINDPDPLQANGSQRAFLGSPDEYNRNPAKLPAVAVQTPRCQPPLKFPAAFKNLGDAWSLARSRRNSYLHST